MMRHTQRWLLVSILVLNAGSIAAGQGDDDARQRDILRAINQRQHKRAVELLNAALKRTPDDAALYYMRGREQFRCGKFKESLADFDKYVQREPRLATRQWERGITCYYAREYKKGAKQFEDYQTYHSNDVENSVWRFLCMAKTEGVEKARGELLPIENDRRIPMMQVYQMYRGKLTPEAVIAAAKEDQPGERTLNSRMFYVDLYLGLYFEVTGEAERAAKHIKRAAREENRLLDVNTYMWDVARIHAETLNEPQ